MSDHQSGSPVFEPTPDRTVAPGHASPRERVALGLLAASVAVLLGVVLSVILWRAGYIASITSLLIAFGGVFLYAKAAGSAPRKGLVPLVLLILAGVVLSFFAIVGSDLWQAYDQLIAGHYDVSRADFLREYGSDIAMFGVFAVLGISGAVRRLLARR